MEWIMDQDEVYTFLEDLDEIQWKYVCVNRRKYADFIQSAINSYDPPPVIKTRNVKYSVQELSDFELFRMQYTERQAYEKRLKEAWELYKTQNNLQRPGVDIDGRIYELSEEIHMCETKLKEIETKRASKYTSPAKRLDALSNDKEYLAQAARLDQFKNEYDELCDKVNTLDAEWEQHARTNFEKTVFEMQ
jgi:uncharacterized coiled-coil DUF342 family protein